MALDWLHFMAFWDDKEEQEKRLVLEGVRKFHAKKYSIYAARR